MKTICSFSDTIQTVVVTEQDDFFKIEAKNNDQDTTLSTKIYMVDDLNEAMQLFHDLINKSLMVN